MENLIKCTNFSRPVVWDVNNSYYDVVFPQMYHSQRRCKVVHPTWSINITKTANCTKNCGESNIHTKISFNTISFRNGYRYATRGRQSIVHDLNYRDGDLDGDSNKSNDIAYVSEMSIVVRDPLSTLKKIRWATNAEDFIGQLGGHFGLLIGASLLTLVEVAEFAAIALHGICKKCIGFVIMNQERKIGTDLNIP